MPIMDNLLSALRKITKEAMKIDFYKAEKSENDLLYLFGVLAFAYAGKKYCSLPFPGIKVKYDGNKWAYIGNMETGKHKRIGIGTQYCANRGSRGNCSHTTYNSINGITTPTDMGLSSRALCVLSYRFYSKTLAPRAFFVHCFRVLRVCLW